MKIARIILALSLALLPQFAIAETQVQAQQPTAAAAATVNAQPDKAVVSKNVAGTTATVTVPASDKPQQFEIPIKDLIDGLVPYIVAAVGAVITGLGTVLTIWLKQRFNIEIDAKNRDALQSAATNAAGALIARGAVRIEDHGITVQSEALAHAANVLIERVPGAIKHFAPTTEQLQNLIVAKVPQVLGSIQPTPATPPPPQV